MSPVHPKTDDHKTYNKIVRALARSAAYNSSPNISVTGKTVLVETLFTKTAMKQYSDAKSVKVAC
jgi:hypothetical protein